MFFTNVLSYVGRKKLADHAYRTTRTELLRNADKLQETLNRHGIKLNRDILSDRQTNPRTKLFWADTIQSSGHGALGKHTA